MGRYFGTTNLSMAFEVSMYSKNTPHSEHMWNAMAHRYRWNNDSFIETACYNSSIIYKIHNGEYELIYDSDEEIHRELTDEEENIEKEKQKHSTGTISCGFDEENLKDEK